MVTGRRSRYDPRMEENNVLARLSADIVALQDGGLHDARAAHVYRALLCLGVTDESARRSLVDQAISSADATGALHLRVLARLIALAFVPEAQRALARELTELMAAVGV